MPLCDVVGHSDIVLQQTAHVTVTNLLLEKTTPRFNVRSIFKTVQEIVYTVLAKTLHKTSQTLA